MIYIITICWNNLAGLKRTWESIQSQNYTNYEWLVVDGASKDGSVEWLNSLDCAQLSYVSEKDHGIYDAMNKSISMLNSRSDGFFIFMNSGDEFHDDGVLSSVSNFDPSNVGMVYGDYVDMHEGHSYFKRGKDVGHIYKGMIASHQAIFFSTQLKSELRYDLRYKLSADYLYIYDAISLSAELALDVVYIDVPICRFYLDGVSVSKRISALKEDYLIRKNHMNLGRFTSSLYFSLHFLHYFLKVYFPSFFAGRRGI